MIDIAQIDEASFGESLGEWCLTTGESGIWIPCTSCFCAPVTPADGMSTFCRTLTTTDPYRLEDSISQGTFATRGSSSLRRLAGR